MFGSEGSAVSRVGRALLCFVLALFVGVLTPGIARAADRTQLASAQARTAQYVFVIDDSGSMSRRVGGEAAADPDRLAVFAARSTLSMLDDVDEATVVRLNGPLEGESIEAIAPLGENRRALENILALDGRLAQYAGDYTPCASALGAVKEALNAAYRPNVAQVVMFLSDGACTGDEPSVEGFLKGLRSAEDELFKFYLIRFEGRDYTPALAELAERTGGMAIEASASDPTAILKPFAGALSRSQGYESYLLTPADHLLDAHRGARRVRLLAVAPDKGRELKFSINPARKGEKPKILGAPETGLHQYADGRRYRYAALDYRPGTVPVTVTVEGAGDDWKVVAVPEYRLFVDMNVSLGRCSEQPDEGKKNAQGGNLSYAEVGSHICVEVRLVNEKGELVTSAVAGRGSEALVRYTRPGGEPSELPAQRRGDAALFEFERANLIKGDHIIRPMVRLAIPGQKGAKVTIMGAAHALQVTSLTISAEPGRVDFGALAPGAADFAEVKIAGNFPAAGARLVVQNRRDVPDCVTFALSGVGEGESQKITPGQAYKLAVEVAPYCGAASFKRDVQTAVRIEFDPAGQLLRPPTLVLPVHFALVNEISTPRELTASLQAGESAELKFRVGGNFKKDARFNVLVPPADEREAWPSGAEELQIQFLDDAGEAIFDAEGKLAEATSVSFAPGGQGAAFGFRVESNACCEGGTYRTELVLAPTSGTKEPIRVPVEITVEPASIWSCRGPMILWALAALLLILLILYVYNMFRNSSFLSKGRLANRMALLEWDATGMPVGLDGGPRKVKNIVGKHFKFGPRLRAWLAANPLKLGLPNDYKYDETVRIIFDAEQPQLSRLKVLEKVDHWEKLGKRPLIAAHIFVSKKRGFYGVPDPDGYFGEFEYEAFMPSPTGDPQRVDLNNSKLLLDDSKKMQGTFAGWKIGY
jgi:hypothetical protein